MSDLPRLGLIFVAATMILTALLANTPVFTFPVALAIGGNVAAAFTATTDLRRMNQQHTAGNRLQVGLFVGGVVALVTATALVTPLLIEGLEAETQLAIQLLVLSTGYAAAMLTWWGRERLQNQSDPS